MLDAIGSGRVAQWYAPPSALMTAAIAACRRRVSDGAMADRQEEALDAMGISRMIQWIKSNDFAHAAREAFGTDASGLAEHLDQAETAINNARSYLEETCTDR
jgi:hypothetical protein